jgi:phosphate transport system permease protein
MNESMPVQPAVVRARGGSHFGDRAFKWLTLLMALSVFALIVLIGFELATAPARAAKIRLAFPRQQRLGPGQRTIRRAAVHLWHARFIAIALLIAVPISIATAVYLTELAPLWLRQPLTCSSNCSPPCRASFSVCGEFL